MSITSFTIVILFLYLAGLKLISLVAIRNSSNNTEDYFLASRNVGTVAIIATTMASVFSTATVVGSPSEFYTKGANFFWILSFGSMSILMIPFVFKFWMLGKKKNFITPGDMTGDFYQSRNVKSATALIGLSALMPYAIAQIVAVGKTFEALTSGFVSYYMAVSIVAIAIGLYLYFGGSRAVILTDVIQGIIFSSLIIISGYLCLTWSDGWNNLVNNLTTHNPENLRFNVGLSYYEMTLLGATFFLLPHIWQRMYMARSSNMIAKNLTALPLVLVLLYSATWLIGISGYSILNPEQLKDTDNLLGAIFSIKAPYFGSFVLVAAFAAGMSTIDSQLLTSGAIVTRDLMPKKLFKSDFDQYKFSRYVTLALLCLCFTAAMLLKNQSTWSLVILGVSLTPIMLPTVIGMFFWNKSSPIAASLSMYLGLVVFMIHAFSPLKEHFPFTFGSVTWSFLVSSITFISVSLVSSGNILDFKRSEYKKILSVLDTNTKDSLKNTEGKELKVAAKTA